MHFLSLVLRLFPFSTWSHAHFLKVLMQLRTSCICLDTCSSHLELILPRLVQSSTLHHLSCLGLTHMVQSLKHMKVHVGSSLTSVGSKFKDPYDIAIMLAYILGVALGSNCKFQDHHWHTWEKIHLLAKRKVFPDIRNSKHCPN